MDDEEERCIASQKAEQTIETQAHYDTKYFAQPHLVARVPREIEEEKKGFLPHSFNRPEFWNNVEPMLHSHYYEPDTFIPSKRV